MNRIHIVGRKNHGKTSLTAELAEELTRRGYAVGTIKHAGHVHEIEAPGKDSRRHREAGGRPAAILTPELTGVFLTRNKEVDPYEEIAPLFRECNLVLVEGDYEAAAPKIEVWRKAAGSEPLARTRTDVHALVTDDPVDVPIPVWSRSDVADLAEKVLEFSRRSH